MKKKLLMLIPLLGLIGLTSCSSKDAPVSEGVALDDVTEPEIDGRSVDERWKEHNCSIAMGQTDETRYGSCEPGDYVYNVEYVLEQPFSDGYCILWNSNFYIWDDMQVQFVFGNGYTTQIETTHNPLGKDQLEIPREDCWKRGLKFQKIVKIRVRTVD